VIVWVDAQMPPAIAVWMRMTFGVESVAVRGIGFRDASDSQILFAARNGGAVVMTKDRDFIQLLEEHGAPPQVLWVTCGNTSNARLREILQSAWPQAVELLAAGEPLVEISDSGA
jgi:predicted nuclease of predicted toxin-antitoxin system